jgi:UDP-N-acetylmuramate dehydrogenase
MNLNDLRRALADRATEGEPLSRHTTFAIGGPADLFVEAHAQDELRTYAQLAWQHRVPYLVLGGGSNVLVADSGIRGLVIHNQCRALEVVPGADHAWLVRAESGAEMREVARQSMSHALSGLEWSVDVPGTVGGAVVGNAGAFGGYVSDSLRGAMVFSPGEEARWWPASELELNYRSSVFKKRFLGEPWSPVILTATFALSSEDATLIGERAAEYKVRRAETQPRGLSAGSVFKRSEQYPAGFLIENAGLKGKQVGEAIISSQHANFIINLGTATACDVRDLMVSIQEAVAREFGVTLEPEIELVGDW